jgi:hypothetical protein
MKSHLKQSATLLLGLPFALVLAAACGDSGSSSKNGGANNGAAGGVVGSGSAALTCTDNAGTCSCTVQPGAPKNTTPCFADKRPASESPNVCCAKAGFETNQVGYECSCAPPTAGVWRCIRRGDGCVCYADNASFVWNSGAGPEIPPSECVPKPGGSGCEYDKNSDHCQCWDPSNFILNYQSVPDCVAPPGGRVAKVCPTGFVRVDACDGDCHSETCFGGAGERCNQYGCTPENWMCIANLCQKI